MNELLAGLGWREAGVVLRQALGWEEAGDDPVVARLRAEVDADWMRRRLALEMSIGKWLANLEARYWLDVKVGSRDCPLCDLFFNRGECRGCPVVTVGKGASGCRETPYVSVGALRFAAINLWTVDGGPEVDDEGRAAIQAEVNFLVGLREGC